MSQAIGGGKIPGVGFACGLDRVALVMEEQGCSFGEIPGISVYCAALDDESRGVIQLLTYDLRKAGISAECDTAGRSFKSQMKIAGSCKFACIIGADELANNSVSVKNLQDGSQVTISLNDAPEYLKARL